MPLCVFTTSPIDFQMMMGDISKSIGDVVKEVAGE